MPSNSTSQIRPWDSDHTALVHVLWEAQRGGITISDADVLAQHIMGSRWMKAVRLHAHERTSTDRSGGVDSVAPKSGTGATANRPAPGHQEGTSR